MRAACGSCPTPSVYRPPALLTPAPGRDAELRDGRAYSGLLPSSRSGMVCIRDALRASLCLTLRITSPSAATAAREFTREYTAATDTHYQYDGSGNTVPKQGTSGTTYYQYDFENLMTRIDFADDSHNYFGYDADSKRVEKRDSEGYSRFVYQGPDGQPRRAPMPLWLTLSGVPADACAQNPAGQSRRVPRDERTGMTPAVVAFLCD